MRFLWGRVRISGNAEDATRLLNLLMDLGVPHRELRLGGGRICISIPEMDEKRVFSACDAMGLSLAAEARSGLLCWLRRYGKRVGLLLGGLLAAAVIFFKRQFSSIIVNFFERQLTSIFSSINVNFFFVN